MSYQEYSQLGRGRQPKNTNDRGDTRRSRSASMARYSTYNEQNANARSRRSSDVHRPDVRRPDSQTSEAVERPYLPSHVSFSTPRRPSQRSSPPTSAHSATPSTGSSATMTSSTSLSPSNSASQLGLKKHKDQKPLRSSKNTEPPGSKLTATSLAQLKDLEKNGSGTTRFGTKRAGLIDVPLLWRPYYLQRKILAAFFAIFAASIIVLEALLDFSGRNAGLLGETNIRLRYLWALLPPAVLTLVAALWGRVEYQAKMAAPWLRLAKGPESVDKSLLLDYFSLVPPRDAIRAMKNGDTAVACAATIALLLRVVIIVSTGMISPTVLENSEQTTPITLTTQFVNDSSRLATIGTLPLLTMVGLQRDNLTSPDGTSSQFAFQQFMSDTTSATQLQTTVDGFAASLSCVSGQLTLNGIRTTQPGNVQFNTTIAAGSCIVDVPLMSQSFSGNTTANRTHFITRMAQASCDGSADLVDQRLVVIFGTGSIDSDASLATAGAFVNGSIPESQQIVCVPQYSIDQVDVIKNGSFVNSVTLNPTSQPQNLSNVTPWSIAQAHFDSLVGNVAAGITDVNTPYYASALVKVNVDAAMYLAFGLQAQADAATNSLATPALAYLDAGELQNLVQNYFQQYAAIIARQALIQPATIKATSAAFIGGDRLVVGTVAAQIIVVLLAIILLFNIVALFTVPGKGFLPRDPQGLLDTAALLAHSKTLLRVLRGTGGADRVTLRNRLKKATYYTGVEPYERGSAESGQGYFRIFMEGDIPDTSSDLATHSRNWHYPFGMHPLQRVVAYLLVVSLIVGLEIGLHMSTQNSGFSSIDAGGIKHFAWTMLPALVASLVATYFAVTDFHVRGLASAAEIAQPKGGSIAAMSARWLDGTALVMLYRAIRQRRFAVAGAAGAVSAAMLLPIFSASLFAAMTIPVSSQVQLNTQDFFSNTTSLPGNSSTCTTCSDGMTLAALVLDGNLSYPAFTYEDLALSSLAIIPLIGVSEADDLETTASVPAVRSVLSCHYFAQGDISVNLTTNDRIGNITNPLRITLPGEPSLSSSELLSSTFVLGTALTPASANATSNLTAAEAVLLAGMQTTTTINSDAFFGVAAYRPLLAANGTVVTHWVYAWGQLRDANTNQTAVQSISAMACNESMQQLNVQATFEGAALVINPEMPPVPLENTVQPSDVALSTTLDYAGLNTDQSTAPNLLDAFFGTLVSSSQSAIGVADLGATAANANTVSGPGTQNNTVAAAIVRQHGLIRAQVVSAFNRRPTTASSLPADVFPVDRDGAVMGNATTLAFTAHMTSVSAGRRRLLQDVATTRVLQALLGLALVCSAGGWAVSSRIGVVGGAKMTASNPLPRAPTTIASVAALLADGNVFAFLGRAPEWQTPADLAVAFRDGLHVTAGFMLGWARAPPVRRRRRLLVEDAAAATASIWGRDNADNANTDNADAELFGINVSRTGGWGGGENVGLGLQARVGYAQRGFVGDWGRRT